MTPSDKKKEIKTSHMRPEIFPLIDLSKALEELSYGEAIILLK